MNQSLPIFLNMVHFFVNDKIIKVHFSIDSRSLELFLHSKLKMHLKSRICVREDDKNNRSF